MQSSALKVQEDVAAAVRSHTTLLVGIYMLHSAKLQESHCKCTVAGSSCPMSTKHVSQYSMRLLQAEDDLYAVMQVAGMNDTCYDSTSDRNSSLYSRQTPKGNQVLSLGMQQALVRQLLHAIKLSPSPRSGFPYILLRLLDDGLADQLRTQLLRPTPLLVSPHLPGSDRSFSFDACQRLGHAGSGRLPALSARECGQGGRACRESAVKPTSGHQSTTASQNCIPSDSGPSAVPHVFSAGVFARPGVLTPPPLITLS